MSNSGKVERAGLEVVGGGTRIGLSGMYDHHQRVRDTERTLAGQRLLLVGVS